jgi:membrane protease YdiL (CAAX protease family)
VSQSSASHAPLKRLVGRYPITAFLILAFACSWAALLPLILSQGGFGLLRLELPVEVFIALASFVGLALPAYLVTAATDGKAGVLDLLHRSLRWRVGVQWYGIALLGTLVGVLVAAFPFVGTLPLQMVARKWELLVTVFVPGVLVPFLLINLPEEIGWTGFVQSKLQERHGPVLASLMVAPPFALIHVPAYFIAGWISDEKLPLPSVLLLVGLTAVVAVFLRLLIMWLYNGSGGSILIVALFHSAFNMSTGQQITPEVIVGVDPSLLNLLAWAAAAVVAVLIAIITSGRFGYTPRSRVVSTSRSPEASSAG